MALSLAPPCWSSQCTRRLFDLRSGAGVVVVTAIAGSPCCSVETVKSHATRRVTVGSGAGMRIGRGGAVGGRGGVALRGVSTTFDLAKRGRVTGGGGLCGSARRTIVSSVTVVVLRRGAVRPGSEESERIREMALQPTASGSAGPDDGSWTGAETGSSMKVEIARDGRDGERLGVANGGE